MQRKRIVLRRQIEGDPIRFSPIGWISFMFPIPYHTYSTAISLLYCTESKQFAIDKQSDIIVIDIAVLNINYAHIGLSDTYAL